MGEKEFIENIKNLDRTEKELSVKECKAKAYKEVFDL
jgi:hypothetical protein